MPMNLSSEETAAWVRLTVEPDLGPAQARLLLSVYGLPQDIFSQSTMQLMKHLDTKLASRLAQEPDATLQNRIDATMHWLSADNHHLLTLADPTYPPQLLEMHDPPLVLYVNGRPELLSQPSLAIVGARSATPAGETNAHDFAQFLAAHGWCIASGLASGIDAAAHQGALNAEPQGAGTIAVLATGIDLVYPARNRNLAHTIAEHGALVSEFPLGQKAMPYHFPKRNRIVAGLSRGVVVVEAALQSGSLITARLASELGREVFAIPGSIHSPLSKGCHALIRQGAKLVESGEHILEELNPSGHNVSTTTQTRTTTKAQRRDNRGQAPNSQAPNEQGSLITPLFETATHQEDIDAVLEAMGYDPISFDLLQQRSRIAVSNLNQALSVLELQGHVARLPSGQYQRQPA
ncbi:MAG: DNA-protecting protein DprA [Alcaligenaceae bacterium]|nr:DNA-protecting protein DprA [Alcaligenaceae bacterium]